MAAGVRAEVTIPAPGNCPLAELSATEGTSGSLLSKGVDGTSPESVTEALAFDTAALPSDEPIETEDGELTPVYDDGTEAVYHLNRPWGVRCVCEHVEAFSCPVTDVSARNGSLYLTFYAPAIEQMEAVVEELRAHYDEIEVEVTEPADRQEPSEGSTRPAAETEPVDPSIDPGSMLLITGPPMTGKFELLLTLLAETTDRPILISTKHPASELQASLQEAVTGPFGIIDCVDRGAGSEDLAEDVAVKRVNSPQNLTRIGTGFTQLLDHLGGDDVVVGCGLYTLSPLVVNTDLTHVYQFVSVLTGHVRSIDGIGFAVLDDGPGGDTDRAQLLPAFDGMLETRITEDGRRQFSVRGVPNAPSGWTPF